MWFDKNHQSTVYIDKRHGYYEMPDRKYHEVKPDTMADFRHLPFADRTFKLVVFDPPHLSKLGKNSWLAKKYGRLFPGWETEIQGGFDECWRVTDINGTLIFKWSDVEIKHTTILKIINKKPLFGTRSGKSGKTIWMTFFKEA